MTLDDLEEALEDILPDTFRLVIDPKTHRVVVHTGYILDGEELVESDLLDTDDEDEDVDYEFDEDIELDDI